MSLGPFSVVAMRRRAIDVERTTPASTTLNKVQLRSGVLALQNRSRSGEQTMEHAAKFEELSLPVIERRRPVRKKSYLRGLTVACDGAWARVCTVRDISEGGAKISVANDQAVPQHAYLVVSKKVAAYEVLVVWARRNEVGLKFVATHPFDSLNSRELQFLRPFVAESVPPGSVI
jgi:hypothetical protein